MPPSAFTPSCKPTSDENAAQIVGEWITFCRLCPHGDAPPVVRIAAKRFAKARDSNLSTEDRRAVAAAMRRKRALTPYKSTASRLASLPPLTLPEGAKIITQTIHTNSTKRPLNKRSWSSAFIQLPAQNPSLILRFKASPRGPLFSCVRNPAHTSHHGPKPKTHGWIPAPIDLLNTAHPAVTAFLSHMQA